LVIHGYPAQRVFEETCPSCGDELFDKTAYLQSDEREYFDSLSEIDEDRLWEHSRRP
jgi:hypothetical protein